MNYNITQYDGRPLSKSKYVMDEKNRIFLTEEGYLTLDFRNLSGWIFKTGSNCTFNTSGNCIFSTGNDCIFDTLWNCTFVTGYNCTFETASNCFFNTERNCIFTTSPYCTFDTASNCTFKTGYNCSFNIRTDFKKIETSGKSTVLIKNKEIYDYLKDKIELYFDKENDEILYTENKLTKDKYLMMEELMK